MFVHTPSLSNQTTNYFNSQFYFYLLAPMLKSHTHTALLLSPPFCTALDNIQMSDLYILFLEFGTALQTGDFEWMLQILYDILMVFVLINVYVNEE